MKVRSSVEIALFWAALLLLAGLYFRGPHSSASQPSDAKRMQSAPTQAQGACLW
jgi:hypothetical protein